MKHILSQKKHQKQNHWNICIKHKIKSFLNSEGILDQLLKLSAVTLSHASLMHPPCFLGKSDPNLFCKADLASKTEQTYAKIHKWSINDDTHSIIQLICTDAAHSCASYILILYNYDSIPNNLLFMNMNSQSFSSPWPFQTSWTMPSTYTESKHPVHILQELMPANFTTGPSLGSKEKKAYQRKTNSGKITNLIQFV